MSKKFHVAVHGLMLKNGTVAPYGTEVEDGVHVENATQKVEDGFLLSKDDFEAKAKADKAAIGEPEDEKSDEEKSKNDKVKKLI